MKQRNKKEKDLVSMREPSMVLVLLNRYIRWVVVITIAIIVLLSYSILIRDKIDEVRAASGENLPQKEKTLREVKDIKAGLDRDIYEFETIRTSKENILERLNLILPSEPEHAQLFTMVDDVTSRSGLKLLNIDISVSGGNSLIDTGVKFKEYNAADLEALLKQVNSMSINISVQGGTYETFKAYLDSLERNIRLFDLKSVSFDGGAFELDADGNPGVPSYSIELVTYYQMK